MELLMFEYWLFHFLLVLVQLIHLFFFFLLLTQMDRGGSIHPFITVTTSPRPVKVPPQLHFIFTFHRSHTGFCPLTGKLILMCKKCAFPFNFLETPSQSHTHFLTLNRLFYVVHVCEPVSANAHQTRDSRLSLTPHCLEPHFNTQFINNK